MISHATKPLDLAAHGTGPRARSLAWKVGDSVMVGAARWLIRTIVGEQVELEASSVTAGIWWRTTLDNLPTKETRS